MSGNLQEEVRTINARNEVERRSGFSHSEAEGRSGSSQLAPLALVNISGLGVKGIANVWTRNATSGRTLVDFFHLDADTWRKEYLLTPSAVDALCDQKSLEANARALQQTLADRGIT